MIFEKGSTRTRCAFEVACNDQGAHSTYLAGDTSHVGKKETIKDTARVLGRMYDAIVYRGSGQENVEALAQWGGVPVGVGRGEWTRATFVLSVEDWEWTGTSWEWESSLEGCEKCMRAFLETLLKDCWESGRRWRRC